ncbi:hypothetical protein GCM10027360_19970 [Amycolatopsis echigonensis]|uniref:hypothetical protein n=1 Tax=Amycolatopsis echigonensis TaxID=2576905 RepID=UPI001FC9141C|nr:hypothetical protein [Amycolatopsis niigatensis]
MPRTPRPIAPELLRPAGRRAGDVRGRELLRALDEPLDDLLEAAARDLAGVREPRAGAFPPLPAVLRFLVADPAMPPR